MRDISTTLKNSQQASTIDALAKIQLTHGASSYTYDQDRILDITHTEEPFTQRAEVVLDNSDGTLTALDLKGFKGVISKGAVTGVGDELSAAAPLWVLSQRFNSSPGKLDCVLSLIGIPNLMAEDKASKNYVPDEDDTKSVKTLIREIAGDTGVTHLGCYSHCQKYDIVFDSEDGLLGSYEPKNGFRIYKNNSRLAVIRRLLDCTKCVMIFKADGKGHIFVPTTSGVVYSYTYSLESGHTFFASAHRKTLIIPNYIYVSSPPHTVPNWVTVTSAPYSGEAKDQTDINKFGERKHTTAFGAGTLESNAECAEYAQSELDRYIALHDPYYEGIAYDQESIDAIGEIRAYQQGSFENDAQAQQVADAILTKYKLNAEMGSASVPVNVAQEVYDYINVVDARQGNERAGNIGRLTWRYKPGRGETPTEWNMTFSFGQRPEAAVDIMPIVEQATPYFGQMIVDNLYAQHILADSLNMNWIDPDNTIDLSKIGDNIDNLQDGPQYAKVKSLHLDAGQIKLDLNVLYSEGFDPTTKEKGISKGPGPPSNPSTGDLWIDTSPLLPLPNIWKRWTGTQWVKATPEDLDEIGDGAVYGRVQSTKLTAEGLVILDELYVDTEGGNFALIERTDMSAGHLLLSSVIPDSEHRTMTDEEKAEYMAKAKVFRQPSMPTSGMVEGDIWYDTDNGQKPYVYTGSAWLVANTEIDGAYIWTGIIDCAKVTIQDEGADPGVEITSGGINIWGKNNALTTRATKTGTIQCYVGSDGAISAGGGNVVIDDNGINIFGKNNALTTRASKTGTVQCYVGSDGKIYAGAGAVSLDSGGVTIKGAKLTLQNSGGAYGAQIYIDSSGNLRLDPWAYMRVKHILPVADSTYWMGNEDNAFRRIYGNPVVPTTGDATEGCISIAGGGSGDIWVYSDGAWRSNT